MAEDSGPVDNAFHAAVLEFRRAIGDEQMYNEILKVQSIDEVYDITDSIQREQSKNGRLRNLQRIEPFLKGMREYVDVIEVFMQVKPDILALIWGPIKLLLQWTSVMKQTFDAIINVTADIGRVLPEFKKATTIFRENANIADALALFFKDILDFYAVTLKFFSQPRLKYLFEPLWPRNRARLEEVTRQIERHARLLRDNVQWQHIQDEYDHRQRAYKHFEKMQLDHQRQEFHSIKIDIAPKTFENKLENYRTRTCEGTGQWLLSDLAFAKWMDTEDASANVFWLKGNPGAGKTFLSRIVVDKLSERSNVSYAFLRHDESRSLTTLAILQSFLFQFTTDRPDLHEVICRSSQRALKENADTCATVLANLVNCCDHCFVIIDGLDEICELERRRLLKILLCLSKKCSHFNLLISSREEHDISEALKGVPAVRVDKRNEKDIATYAEIRTLSWLNETQFLEERSRQEAKRVLGTLASNAKGMFLYVRIIMDYLSGLSDVDEIRNELRVLPNDLDEVYARIVTRIDGIKSETARKKARRILGWVACSPIPLTVQELEQALVIDAFGPEGKANVDANVPIRKLCGPIIEVTDEYVHFVHFTFKEYIFSKHMQGTIGLPDATLSLTKCCLIYLGQSHHDLEIKTDDEIKTLLLGGIYRLENFASMTWLLLIERSCKLISDGKMKEEFIETLQKFKDHCENNSCSDEFLGSYNSATATFLEPSTTVQHFIEQSQEFRKLTFAEDFNLEEVETWIERDPTIIYFRSSRIHDQLKQIITHPGDHEDSSNLIRLHYGSRPIRCTVLSCREHRYGFSSVDQLKAHKASHAKPWKCNVEGCDFAKGGFLSKKMRDDHLSEHANTQRSHLKSETVIDQNVDEDETKSLLLDLIRANKISEVEDTVKLAGDRVYAYLHELRKVAAFSATPEMLNALGLQTEKLCVWEWQTEQRSFCTYGRLKEAGLAETLPELTYSALASLTDEVYLGIRALTEERGRTGAIEEILDSAFEGKNLDVVKAILPFYSEEIKVKDSLLYRLHDRRFAYSCAYVTSTYFAWILRQDSEEWNDYWTALISTGFSGFEEHEWLSERFALSLTCRVLVTTSQGVETRVQMIVRWWCESDFYCRFNSRSMRESYFDSALDSWSRFGNSVGVMELLLNCGASVNYQSSARAYSPLRLVAQRSSAEAAKTMKLLLQRGARSTDWKSSERSIGEEKGAKSMQKWLGVTWDDLVAQIEDEKSRGVIYPRDSYGMTAYACSMSDSIKDWVDQVERGEEDEKSIGEKWEKLWKDEEVTDNTNKVMAERDGQAVLGLDDDVKTVDELFELL